MKIYLDSGLVHPIPGIQGIVEKRTPIVHAVNDVLNPGLYLLPLGIPRHPRAPVRGPEGSFSFKVIPYRR